MSESRQIRRYGFRPGLPGVLREPADTSGLKIAKEADPRKHMPKVFDQGQLGSCTANATAAAFQYDSILDGHGSGGCGKLSRLWIYYQERKLEGTLGQGDTGAMGHDAFIAAAEVGVPPETAWPYDIDTFQGPPPKAAVEQAGHYRLTKPVKAPAQEKHAIQQVLSNNQTVSIGFTVYQSFEGEQVARQGIMPMPKPGEKVLGGHEVLVVGYLAEEPDYALVRNSWGSEETDGVEWGIDGDGYFLMPWEFLLDPSRTSDLRTIVRGKGK